MRVQSSQVEMQAVSTMYRREATRTSLDVQLQQPQDTLNLSEEGLHAAEDLQHPEAVEDPEELLELTLSEEDKQRIHLLEKLLSWLTGKAFKFTVFALRKDKASQAHLQKMRASQNGGGIAVRYHRQTSREEYHSLDFSSTGKVVTKDGREIDFQVNLHMSRARYESSSIDLRVGNFVDPLVLHFDGPVSELNDEKIELDLDFDGTPESFHLPGAGSGFLVFDRNENGLIDDGSELFGPASGNGFRELGLLDEDGNGWIDEGDQAFSKLQIWSFDADGNGTLSGLLDKDVGAIYLGNVHTSYEVTSESGDTAGNMKAAGTYLKESGGAGVIHELDVRV